MWKRSDSSARPLEAPRTIEKPTPETRHVAERPVPQRPAEPPPSHGAHISIRGEVTGDEDLTINGVVEGTIQLPGNGLTIGANGAVKASVVARRVTIMGRVVGDVVASELVAIGETGHLEGNIVATRVALADGATFRGRVEMREGVELPEVRRPRPLKASERSPEPGSARSAAGRHESTAMAV